MISGAMTAAVLFDLGNTLAAYYHASEFRPILAKAIGAVRDELSRRRLGSVPLESAVNAAINENREAPDYRFTPMIERIERIFQVPLTTDPLLAATLCKRFLEPIFAVGRVYSDTLPALAQLRGRGVRTAIVSNAPWGSPPELWRHELDRLGLSDSVDTVVLCGMSAGENRLPSSSTMPPRDSVVCQRSACSSAMTYAGTSKGVRPSACAPCSSIAMVAIPSMRGSALPTYMECSQPSKRRRNAATPPS
jgi:FMN phosphatase YigB (HAD superfamily)